MAEPLVRVEVAGGVATITLDSPANRNALSQALMRDLHDALDTAERCLVRTIVLTHAGPAFCSGADLKERAAIAGGSAPSDQPGRTMVDALQRLIEARCPTIAVVKGAVRAGGIGLMAACDMVAVAPQVTFAFTEVRIGVVPAIISVPILRRVSPAHLTAPFLTGEPFDAHHAAAIGLVDAVGDPDQLAAAWCAGLRSGAPGAVAATKALLRTVPGRPLPQAFADMAALSAQMFAGDEAREGMAAFAERRPPRWAQETV